MLVRIWWKEGRSIAPIALTLAATLVALQWFLLAYGGREIRGGVLVPIALGWAVLYALVVGSASFAGEREARMMGFLDALPVGRGMLWLGKASFAMGSSLLLGVAFRLAGQVGYPGVEAKVSIHLPAVDSFFAVLLVEAAIWGLFWSSVSKHALTAGVLAVLTTASLAGPEANAWSDFHSRDGFHSLNVGFLAFRVALMAVALGCSWLVVRAELEGWSFPSRAPRATSEGLVAPARARRPVRLDPAFWSIAWQTVREGRAVWAQATLLALAIPGLELFISGPGSSNLVLLLGMFLLALLIQGVSVFGLENAAGTRQFLDNQAVSPRTAWAAKVAAWLLGVVVTTVLLVIGSTAVALVLGRGVVLGEVIRDSRGLVFFLSICANCLATGMVGGMVFPRRITAALLSGVTAVAVVAPQVGLFQAEMIPAWSLVLVPSALVGISLLWAGDWLAVRGDWRRWGRLAALGFVPAVVLCLWYVAARAWGIPDIGPQFDPTTRPAGTATGLNGDYRRVAAPLAASANIAEARAAASGLEESGWKGASPEVIGAWERHRAVIDEARRLAARPGPLPCDDRPVPSESAIPVPREDRPLFDSLTNLAALLALDGIERRSRADFAGAWEDILAQYRMSSQAAAGASTLIDYSSAMRLAEGALLQALAWAREQGLTRDNIQDARRAIQDLPLPTMVAVLRAESGRIEAALDLPTETWVDALASGPSSGRRGAGADDGLEGGLERIGLAWFVVPSWERERARRLVREATRLAIQLAQNDVHELDAEAPFWPSARRRWVPAVPGSKPSGPAYLATPMAGPELSLLIGAERVYDRELANRRALDTFLALRAWQVGHEGRAPESLAELIPGELERIPADPFSPTGGPLGYNPMTAPSLPPPIPRFCLSSVGANGFPEPLLIDGPDPYRPAPVGDDLRFILPATIPPPEARR